MTTKRTADEQEINQAITSGIVFRPSKKKDCPNASKVKTKAKKKAYVTGAHGSGAAKKKAQIKQKRANRNKK